MKLTPAPQDIGVLLAPELLPGEQLVWHDQPVPRMIFRREIGGVVFGVIWFAASLVSAVSQLGGLLQSQDLESTVILVGFLLMTTAVGLLPGLLFLASPYWSWRNAKRTYYALTNQRAIIFLGCWWKTTKVYAYVPAQLAHLRRVQFADGTGHLFFDPPPAAVSRHGDSQTPVILGFIGVRNVKEVATDVERFVQSPNRQHSV
jgi:uncharacterized membrane protein